MIRIVIILLILTWSGGALAQSPALRDLHAEVQRLFQAGYYEQALPHAEEAAEMSAAEFGAAHPTTAALLFNLAEVRRFSGHLDAALASYGEALAIQEGALVPDDLSTAQTLSALATTHDLQGAIDTAAPLHDRALRIVSDLLSSLKTGDRRTGRLALAASIYRARRLANRAMEYHRDGNLEDAEWLLRSAANAIETNDGLDSRKLIPLLTNLARFLRATGRTADAADVEARLSRLGRPNAR
ncbi:MAG: tetratricopeptide repeat protein [Alphaproteobacteria bacterium]|jgi:tetratricopeptide (TPR) repeat protein|nr:tetratricopeptide repeat protein [Alphaproteobacteria bacterium]